MSAPPPLILLSGHRTGSSAVMGILVTAGVHVGEVLPPSVDNPKGYFENRMVVAENTRLLGSLDRDWTCPPSRWPGLEDPERLKQALADCRGEEGRPWGIKDPRLLFTLPAWLPLIDEAIVLGVDRPVASVAQSIHRRDGIALEFADGIARAHSDRLWALAEELDFPIIGFGEDSMFDQIQTILEAIGLRVSHERLHSVFDPDLVHHRNGPATTSRHGSVTVLSRSVIDRGFRRCEAAASIQLRTDQGPVFQQRTRELLRMCVGTTRPGRVALIADPHARTPALDVPELHRLTEQELRTAEPASFSHVVGPLALDRIPPSAFPSFLEVIGRVVDQGGAVAVSGELVDDPRSPSSIGIAPIGVIASRSAEPYLHRRDEIELALMDTPWHMLDVTPTAGGRTQLRLGRDPRLRAPGVRPAHELRLYAATLEVDLADRDREIQELDRSAREAVRRIDDLETQLVSIRQQLTEAASQTSEQRERGDRHAQNAAKLQETVNQQRKELERLVRREKKLSRELSTADRRYQRLAGRRSVRIALGLSKLAAPLFRLVRKTRRRQGERARPAPSKPPQIPTATAGPPPRRAVGEVTRSLKAARSDPGAAAGPLVSIIVLTRNGAHHLEVLFPRLSATVYRSFEVIVVDNASSDDTSRVLAQDWGFPLRVIRNEHNASFSDGNNQGLTIAEGDLLLFLNNDLEPINDSWLGAMVDAMLSDVGPAAVGALLVYPQRGEPETDLTVQHRGIGFGFRNGAPHAFNLAHPDPTDPSLLEVTEVPAVTAAALMCRRESFEAVGGFTSGYVYGTEDVDLCLKLREHGPIVLAGGAAIFHHESATQRASVPDIVRINRIGNWQRFAETWGPQLTRSIRRDRMTGTGTWTGRTSRTVVITVTKDDPAAGFGDYFTAHELGDAMAGQGWDVRYAQRVGDEWYDIDHDVDVMIVLLDSFDVSQAPPGVYTIAWVRNWVERWISQPWFEQFDLVVCSSSRAATEVASRSRFDPPVLPLAANPERFAPGAANPTFESDYAFTGSNWGRGREIIPLLDVRPGETFLLFGANWDNEPRVRRYWRGLLDYELIPELYRSTKIVLDDTAEHTIEHGFVNSRVFDALAAGALVVSNNEIGSDELFDGLLPVYSDRASLRQVLDRYLADPEERAELVQRLREIVLERHTYDRRAQQFVETAIAAIDRPRVAVKIGAPKAETAHAWGDYHYANALVRAFATLGWSGEVHLLPQWDDPDKQDVDIVIHLRGLTTYAPKPSHVNVMWLISHPDDVSLEEYDKYDLVCVASRSLAERLREHIETPVWFLPQATDATQFGDAQAREELLCDFVFVGNSRKQRRQAVDWAVAAGTPLTVYGSDWEEYLPVGYVKDTYFPNEELGDLYASAKIVLNDHWPDMRNAGIVSNRILDALAAGAFVISDDVEGLAEVVGDAVPTFDSQEELETLVQRYLADDDERARLAKQGRRIVLDEHTFERRARQLIELIAPLLEGRSADCDGHRF